MIRLCRCARAMRVASCLRRGRAGRGVAPRRAMSVSGDNKAAFPYFRSIIDEDLRTGVTDGRVATRFPPEPNGYLHIGHALAVCVNFELARAYGGTCNLRFDDTNPLTEDVHFTESIAADVEWLGYQWDGEARYASDYFPQLYAFAERLVEQGDAYVDSQDEATIQENRGSIKKPGVPSPFRERSVEENMDLLRAMRRGEVEDGAAVLRAKIDMAAPLTLMRDPLLYRIKRSAVHHRTGREWPIYPMYDFAHPLSDAIEGITHSICTLEFDVHRPFYDWVVAKLFPEGQRPRQYEVSRFNLEGTVTSKRILRRLVETGAVSGWDDPRMPTLAGLRRRGVTPSALRDFCKSVGVSRTDKWISRAELDEAIRDDLGRSVPRVMAVLDPLRVVITNFPDSTDDSTAVEVLEAPLDPRDPSSKTRKIPFTREIYIERDDFRKVAPKKFRRLHPGGEVRLRYGYVVRCDDVVEDPATGAVVELRCSYDPASKSGPGARKTKGTIHWVSASQGVPARVNVFEPLLRADGPGAQPPNDADAVLERVNPESKSVLEGCILEPYVADRVTELASSEAAIEESGESEASGLIPRFQFERQGYFAADMPSGSTLSHQLESAPGTALALNRVVPLKDSWAKQDPGSVVAENKNQERKERGKGGKGKGSGVASETPDFCRVNLVVGRIVSVEEHPDADRLWVEQIDIGEDTGPRTIVSGLRDHYTREALEGSRVVVVANLKPAKLRGIKSHGMVLAAASTDGSIVELVEPPMDAQEGSRVGARGVDFAGTEPDASINPKAKTSVWPRVQTQLRVDAQGQPCYEGAQLCVEGVAGFCSVASLADVDIS